MEPIWVMLMVIPSLALLLRLWRWHQAKNSRRVMRCLQMAVRQSRAA